MKKVPFVFRYSNGRLPTLYRFGNCHLLFPLSVGRFLATLIFQSVVRIQSLQSEQFENIF